MIKSTALFYSLGHTSLIAFLYLPSDLCHYRGDFYSSWHHRLLYIHSFGGMEENPNRKDVLSVRVGWLDVLFIPLWVSSPAPVFHYEPWNLFEMYFLHKSGRPNVRFEWRDADLVFDRVVRLHLFYSRCIFVNCAVSEDAHSSHSLVSTDMSESLWTHECTYRAVGWQSYRSIASW